MIARAFARVYYAGAGALVWSSPGYLVGWLAEPAWPYVFFPLLAYGAWRGVRVGVREEPGALRVRNLVLSFRIPWADVVDVTWDESYAAPQGFVVPLVRVPGRKRPIPVLAVASFMSPSRAESERARSWTGAAPTTSRRAPRRRGRR